MGPKCGTSSLHSAPRWGCIFRRTLQSFSAVGAKFLTQQYGRGQFVCSGFCARAHRRISRTSFDNVREAEVVRAVMLAAKHLTVALCSPAFARPAQPSPACTGSIRKSSARSSEWSPLCPQPRSMLTQKWGCKRLQEGDGSGLQVHRPHPCPHYPRAAQTPADLLTRPVVRRSEVISTKEGRHPLPG